MKPTIVFIILVLIMQPVLAQRFNTEKNPISVSNKLNNTHLIKAQNLNQPSRFSSKNHCKDEPEIYELDSLVWLWYDYDQWLNSSKEEYEFYNTGLLKTWIMSYSDWENGGWMYSSLYNYEYNEDGLLTQEIQSGWDYEQGEWVQTQKIEYTYNEAGFVNNTTTSNWNQTLNYWIPSYQTNYTYNDHNDIIEILSKEWQYVYWVNSYKSEYEYNEEFLEIAQTNYSWNGSWVVSDHSEKEYDETGNLLSFTSFYWNAELNQWENSYRYEEQYDEYGNLVLHTEMYWDYEAEDWVGNYKTEMIYDKQNLLTEKYTAYFDWEQHIWTYSEKYEYAYDFLNNLETLIYSSTGGIIWEKDTEWVPGSRTSYIYNYEYDVTDLYVPGNYEYQYMITEVNQESWLDDHWENGSKGNYYYSLFVNTQIFSPVALEFVVYPNPASEQIQVNWGGAIPEYMLQVINSAGQIVFSQNVRRHDYIDVSNLAKGTYVFTFSNRLQHNEISKKVIIR